MILVFFFCRVCVKKSTQERLALKILIDRPKARNEVRGNAVMVVINTCCLLFGAVSVCFVLPACYQSLLIPVFVFFLPCFSCTSACLYERLCLEHCSEQFVLAASPCHQQPPVLIKQLMQQLSSAVKTSYTDLVLAYCLCLSCNLFLSLTLYNF